MDRFGREPSLEELLSDPIIHRMMRADDVSMLRLCEILVKASGFASAARCAPVMPASKPAA